MINWNLIIILLFPCNIFPHYTVNYYETVVTNRIAKPYEN